MRHPLEFIPAASRRPLFYFFFALTVILFSVFGILDVPLKTAAAPNGVVSYELAGTFENSQTILSSWDEHARQYAAFGLGLDYLFMPAYALALSLGLLLAGMEKPKTYQTLTSWLGWGALAAAVFDAVENFALWKILIGDGMTFLPQIAAFCAAVKFGFLIGGLLIAAMGWFIKKESRG